MLGLTASQAQKRTFSVRTAGSLLLFLILATSLVACQKKDEGGSGTARPPAQMKLPGESQPQTDQPISTPAPAAPQIPLPGPPPKYREIVNALVQEAIQNGYRDSKNGVLRQSHSSSPGYFIPHCAEGVDCRSKFVGIALTSKTGAGASCSGVLIAKDLVLTNRHCAKMVVERANDSFDSGSIWLAFPRSKKDLESDEVYGLVQNVVLLSPEDIATPLSSPDWAILKIKESMPIPRDVRLPKINRDGIKEGKIYYVYSRSPYADAADPNAVEKRACKAVYRTAFATWLDRPLLPVIELSDCPIGPGNSGAPIYNEEGELVGIIGGQFNPKLLQALSSLAILNWGVLDSPKGFSNIGWGMTMACIPDLDDPNKELPGDCDLESREAPLMQLPESALEKAKQVLAEVTPPSDKFHYSIVRAAPAPSAFAYIGQALVFQTPDCILPEALASLQNGEVTLNLNSSGVMLSAEGVPLDKAATLHRHEVKLVFDLDTLRKNQAAVPMSLQLSDPVINLHRGELRLCMH